jgi:hypothetical protein
MTNGGMRFGIAAKERKKTKKNLTPSGLRPVSAFSEVA